MLWNGEKRRESVVIFIAQTRCTMGEVHQHCSPLNRRCSRGESASSVEKVVVREVTARCIGSGHTPPYHATGLDALRARWHKWEMCGKAREGEVDETW